MGRGENPQISPQTTSPFTFKEQSLAALEI